MVKGDIPKIDPNHPQYSEEEQRAYYEDKGIVFVEDIWSLWHIRVWVHARDTNGFGVMLDRVTIFKYAEKFGMDELDTLERIKNIERGVSSE
jgi:hypothetical protein